MTFVSLPITQRFISLSVFLIAVLITVQVQSEKIRKLEASIKKQKILCDTLFYPHPIECQVFVEKEKNVGAKVRTYLP